MERGAEGRFEETRRRISAEEPFGRGIEARGDHSIEDGAEREQYWLAGLVNPNTVDWIMNEHPLGKHVTREQVVYSMFQAKFIEGSKEWDPRIQGRVRNLLMTLRASGLSTMGRRELVEHSTLDLPESGTLAAAHLEADASWVWQTFDLQAPPVFRAATRDQ